MLRLIALIMARYNWRNDELSVGQRDMAHMWSVNERTVKREIKRLTEANILICKRAGVRGRVGAHHVNKSEIARLSRPAWQEVGPDFAYRVEERYCATGIKILPINRQSQLNVTQEGEWGACGCFCFPVFITQASIIFRRL